LGKNNIKTKKKTRVHKQVCHTVGKGGKKEQWGERRVGTNPVRDQLGTTKSREEVQGKAEKGKRFPQVVWSRNPGTGDGGEEKRKLVIKNLYHLGLGSGGKTDN